MSIKLKQSNVAGKVPQLSDLVLGELAINTYDGRVFLKRNNGTEALLELALLESGALGITSLNFGNWSLLQNGTKLELRYNGTTRMALDSSGNLTVTGDVTAFGAP